MTKLSPDLAAMARKNEQKILNLIANENQKDIADAIGVDEEKIVTVRDLMKHLIDCEPDSELIIFMEDGMEHEITDFFVFDELHTFIALDGAKLPGDE